MSDVPQPIQQAAIQQALTDNNNDQDEASWSLYDYGSMYVNQESMDRDNIIIHGDLTSITLYGSPRNKAEYHTLMMIGKGLVLL